MQKEQFIDGTDGGAGYRDDLKGKTRAFTLIELLVVIAIISILAAILFPVFARARENARRTNCLSNQKQIGLAVMQYTQDFDERLPGYAPSSNIWAKRIDAYLKSRQALICPNDQTSSSSAALTTANLSYGWNYANLAMGTSGVLIPASGSSPAVTYPEVGRHLAEFAYPAQTVIITDSGNRGSSYVSSWDVNATYRESGAYRVMALHLDGANAAFLDGHAKWYPVPGPLTATVDMWNRD